MKKKTNFNSIKFKLTVLPLIILFISFTYITVSASYIIKTFLINNMKNDGITLARQIAQRMGQSNNTYVILNEQVEDKIRSVAKDVLNETTLSNETLKKISQNLNVDEINYVDASGKIIYSNLPENIGYIFKPDHISQPVLSGSKQDLMESIRKSTIGENYYKYGYVHNPKGGMIQVGVLSNNIQSLYSKINYQAIIDELGKNPDIVYAIFIDKNLKVVAHSNKDRIGIELNDEGSKKAAVEGKEFSSEYYYDVKKVKVYDILTPVYVNDELIGAVDIGLSMKNIYDSVNRTRIIFSSIGFICFIIVALILYFLSNSSINVLKNVKVYLELMSKGDLSNSINEKYIKRKDEFGEISKSIDMLSKTFKNIIKDIKMKSGKIDQSCNTLLSTSQEMAASSEQVSATMNEVAKGAQIQSQEISDIVNLMQNLSENMDNIYEKLKIVKNSAEDTTSKVNVGKTELNNLLKSISNIKESFNIVNNKVNNLSTSISKVNSITDAITTIAEQTNLLALNAAIEAARAGESGKGFAVVAEEVRKLAEESRQFADEIKNLILSINQDTKEVIMTSNEVDEHVKSQIDTVDNTVKSFENILSSVEEIAPNIEDVFKSVDLTVEAKDTILSKTENISSIIEESSASTEEVSASSEEMSASAQEVANSVESLTSISNELINYVEKFKI